MLFTRRSFFALLPLSAVAAWLRPSLKAVSKLRRNLPGNDGRADVDLYDQNYHYIRTVNVEFLGRSLMIPVETKPFEFEYSVFDYDRVQWAGETLIARHVRGPKFWLRRG